ncbi:MAG: biotin--[acetyl-CoA-carboxylase] ligase [Alphaproteobacteria bacterium]
MQWKKVHFDVLESTNKTAALYDIGTVVRADSQTGGRGRYGCRWVSPAGNLYMSVVLKTYDRQTPLMAFVTAVAVAEAFFPFDVRLKWPNDILKDQKKVAGILLECLEDKLIVGIGANLISHPTQGIPYAATDFCGAVSAARAEELILDRLAVNISLFETTGFEAVRDKWKRLAVGIGTHITVRLPHERLTGIFKDLSQSGALLLQLPDDTIKEITAGVVFFDN